MKKLIFLFALLSIVASPSFGQSRSDFSQRFGLYADFGATRYGGFTMDLNLSLGQAWIGMNVSFPSSPAKGTDFTSVIFSNQYLDQQLATYPDVYAGSFNLCLGYMPNENNVFGVVLGEVAYKDILQFYGQRISASSPDWYHITLSTYDYFNYGLFLTHNFTSRRSPFRLYATAIWTRYDGLGLLAGVGYAFHRF